MAPLRSRNKVIPLDILATFALASLLLALAPGPDNIFVMTQSAVSGARAGVMVVLGLCSGLVFHSAAVALGLAALIAASPAAFTALKFAGAGYLLYLAYGAFRAGVSDHAGKVERLSDGALYRRGVIMNISNPKVAIFFLAFFPQFMSTSYGPTGLQVGVLGLTFMVVAFLTFGAIALMAGWLSGWLTRTPKAEIVINRIAGLVFLGLALKLVLG